MRAAAIGLAVLFASALAAPAAAERAIEQELVVDAPLERVWRAWTTEEGIESFLAPSARVEARPDGAFEVFFAPDAPAGQRGAEGMRYLLVDPMSTIAFTWSAPPKFPAAREQRTHVVLRFEALAPGTTRVRFRHDGFGTGEEWDQVIDYFERAWKKVVLPRFAAVVAATAPDGE